MKKIITIIALTAASGCASNAVDLSPAFGRAQQGNDAAQIVDPTPATDAPRGDGVAIDNATERYRKDDVKQPVSGKLKPGGGGAPK